MRNLRIVFMGTPQFAVTTLEEIIKAGYEVAGVVTAPDRPAGRGRKIQESAVKQFAVSAGLKVLQPTNLKSPEFLEELKAIAPNVQVVVAFRMLPRQVWQLPEYGTFNLHASLLPHYRGAAPINWAIINGETATGVSTFFIDEKIDTGEMIMQLEIPIKTKENAGDLHDKLMYSGAKLVVETLEKIKTNTAKPGKQDESAVLKDAPKLSKENTRIDWNAYPLEIYNLIRGLNPYPGAWTILEEKDKKQQTVKIFDAIPLDEKHDLPHGTLIQNDKNLKVAVQEGFLEITEIQLPGKRKMKTIELLNGYEFKNPSKLL